MQPVTERGSLCRLGIIIVTHQSARHIVPLWRSLAATLDPQRTSICVFDNASSDETVAILKRENAVLRLPLQLICSETNLGFAQANNEAFDRLQAQSNHDVIILLNPDTVVQTGWWEPLVETLEDPGIGTVASLLLLPDGKINSRGNALHFLGLGYVQGLGENISEAKLDEPFFFGSGAALAIDVEALARMNALFGSSRIFWDELFIYAEDSDLGWRMRLAGFQPKLCAVSRVTHDYHFPIAKPIMVEDRLFWIERNRYLLLIANFKAATLFLLLPWIIASELALACRLWKLYPHRLRLWRALGKEICSPTFRSRRRGLQTGRKGRDRDILRAMTGSIRHGARAFGTLDKLLDGVLRGSHQLLCRMVWW
jgi:GT2 family glycosyltransferase